MSDDLRTRIAAVLIAHPDKWEGRSPVKKRLALALTVTAAALLSSAPAHADGYLTAQERAVGDSIAGSMCGYIDRNGVNATSMEDAMRIIYRYTPDDVDISDTVDIINYIVSNYCPEHWGELVAFGEGARSQ